MPCYDATAKVENDTRRDKLDELTNIVCEYCTIMENAGGMEMISKISPRLGAWWEQHKINDVNRGVVNRKQVKKL